MQLASDLARREHPGGVPCANTLTQALSRSAGEGEKNLLARRLLVGNHGPGQTSPRIRRKGEVVAPILPGDVLPCQKLVGYHVQTSPAVHCHLAIGLQLQDPGSGTDELDRRQVASARLVAVIGELPQAGVLKLVGSRVGARADISVNPDPSS